MSIDQGSNMIQAMILGDKEQKNWLRETEGGRGPHSPLKLCQWEVMMLPTQEVPHKIPRGLVGIQQRLHLAPVCLWHYKQK